MVENRLRKKNKEQGKIQDYLFSFLERGVHLNHMNDDSKIHICDRRTFVWLGMSEFSFE